MITRDVRNGRRVIVRGPRQDAASDLAELTAHTVRIVRRVGVAARPRKVLPAQIPPSAIAREYTREILAFVALVHAAFEPFLAELPRLMASAASERRIDSGVRTDAGEGKRIRELLNAARARLGESVKVDDIERLARKFAKRTATYQRIQLGKQVRAALGVDVFLQDRALKSLTEAFIDANVGLIKDIGDKLATDIEFTTMRAVQSGMLHPDLAKQLKARFGFSEERAKLIARDQIGKAYGQINAARQRELGVEEFIWRSVRDRRVRHEHAERDGKTYSYAKPPDGELPGEPVLCRCFAEPVLDKILDLAG